MLRLVFDTSSDSVSVGLWDSSEGYLEVVNRSDLPKQQSKLLFQVIQDLLTPLGVEKKEIEEIAVGIGPGSYTGLRMGLTVAKVWAYAQKVKVLSFSSSKVLERTRLLNPEAKYPDISFIEAIDLTEVFDLQSLSPIYENDHFGDKGGA